MYRCILALALVLPLSLVGCKKASTQGTQNDKTAESPATPAVSSTPTPVAVATPIPPPAIDRSARVIVLCYHRFEDRPKDQLAIAPAEFKTQMQQLKDAGIQVVAMKDFLAWRRGEKSI